MVKKTPIGRGKTKFIDPYQDIDIFSGPAGKTLVDIDPNYGGIQLEEDELLGNQLSRNLARFSKGMLEYVSPSEETQQEQADIRQSNQESLAALYSMTGIDPESFEGKQLAARIGRDKGLQKLMGYDPGGILTGGGTTERPQYGLFDIGNFFFGDARKGLTSMVDEGIKYKELPFEQKLGIAILPIDLIDVAGVGYLAKAPIGALMRAGVKTFGKNSKLTVKELVDNPEFMTKYLEQNPNAAKDLDQYGFDIQKRYASGKKKRGPTPIERDTGIEIIGRDFLQEQKQIKPGVDDSIEKQVRKDFIEKNRFQTDLQRKAFETPHTSSNPERLVFNHDGVDYVKVSKNSYVPKDQAELVSQKYTTMDRGKERLKSNFRYKKKNKDVKGISIFEKKLSQKPREIKRRQTRAAQSAGEYVNQYERRIDTAKKGLDEYLENNFDLNPDGTYDVNRNWKADAVPFLLENYGDDLVVDGKPFNRDVLTQIVKDNAKLKDFNVTVRKGKYRPTDSFYAYYTDKFQDVINRVEDVTDPRTQRTFQGTNPEFRFIDFMGKTRKDLYGAKATKDGEDFSALVKEYDPRRLNDPNYEHYEAFQRFAFLDEARIEANELMKPILKKIFSDTDRQSLQIAHKYESSGIATGYVDKSKAGTGGSPFEMYIDLSEINQGAQKTLEAKARKLVNEYKRLQGQDKPTDQVLKKIYDIHDDMVKLGVQGQAYPFVLGAPDPRNIDEKISALIKNAQEKGIQFSEQELKNAEEAVNLLVEAGDISFEKYGTRLGGLNKGGLVGDVDDIFEEEDEIMKAKKSIFPRISVEFGDAARGTKRSFGEKKPEEEIFDLEQKTTAAPMQKTFDVQPTENIFTGEVEQANLKLPFFKLFTKPPVSETAPIPTPKENLNNPTKKQKESLELEKEKKKDEVFDPTPEDNDKVKLVDDVDIAVTPKTNQPITGVFYSDIERVLARPDTPEIFVNKKALLDFFRKNRIRDSEFRDYQIESLLRIYDENTPIPKQQVIQHLRQSPIRGMHVHATGQGSEIINPYGEVGTRYTGYAEPGYISGTQRERVLYIPGDKIAGDSGVYPQSIFPGESVQRHDFGIPQGDNSYIVGWSRLTDRNAILPTKIAAPKTQSKVPGLTRERERAQRQVAGLYAEAINKLNREGVRRGFSQGELDELSQLSLEQIQSQYADTLNRLSPGLLDQMDELIVKVRDIDAEIVKGSNVDTSGVVRVAFADEIQSDIMQAAAGRKQKLVATLRKIQDEGRESTTLPELSRVGQQALEFFEENKSVFRPLRRTQAEVDIIGERLTKLDAEVDEIINRYIETRELDPASVTRLQEALTENINQMINDLIVIDSKTYDGLFPDIPFKKREEWADALIKKDLFELAYQKFVLKDPNAPDYYSVTPDQFVIDRYNFNGNSATPMDVRAADKKAQIDYFTARGEFKGSEYKGIGMSEFYGGPNAKTPDGKHYTSVIEKILKTQAKSNNSEFTVLNVQTKSGGKDVFIVRDQNGNMVATLTSQEQATRLSQSNPNYKIETLRVPDNKNTTPSFAIKITEEMLEPYKTHKAKGGLVQMIDIFEVA